MALSKKDRRIRIKRRVRKVVKGSSDRPRMSVFRSNKEIYVQLIDDATGTTLLTASSSEAEIAKSKANKVEKAALVGKAAAAKAKAAGIETVSFDRNGYLYHGRIKSLAEGAREGGLNF
ncbi:50S ribosomal protein L18 [Acidiluteibacter ferrifornacis]|jgi:large subunit ribosomal protein L18|uniref:Large ribosomal subunit protein uL18 n=1 Tax=Acidiluteibacter ferrifornacis TaxID=2692424 RepID=A0A6N9NIT8_9FLAO|nr:50S ribosomal protein L18 [Acidiluteibacter ferrifornacis]MBR9832235.1 50S ribosomal protein L18 [bacterium]NBG65833.1 50S ribosomal protein L18 [Acidiluteibacter ferrifornacis]